MARIALEQDFSYIKNMWTTCFDDPPAFVDWNFTYNYNASNTLVAEADGVPVSNMQLMPYDIRLGQCLYHANYVSGVATMPDFRHRGLVRELFDLGFEEMQRRRQPLSVLVPFNYGFYEKFGYKQCYWKLVRHLDELPPASSCLTLAKQDLNEELSEILNKLYLAEMKHKIGCVVRTSRDWQLILEDLLELSQGYILAHRSSRSHITGYALVTPDKQGGFTVHEVCGNIPLPCCTCSIQPFAMARIIDARRILMDLARHASGSLRLRLRDPHIPANNFTVELTVGEIRESQAYDFDLDIGTLTQLVFHFIPDFTNSRLFERKAEPYINMLL